jgi:predicted nucleotidyltransferase
MRLNENYIKTIKKSFSEVFVKGEIYLFGGRVDDSKKGGDIDLYLVVEDKINLFKNKIKFLAKIKRELGEQKIDVIFNLDENRLIEKEAKQWGIKL